MYLGFYEEGDRCPKCHKGIIEFQKPENCSCHISPPCRACTSVVLECHKCGWTDDPPEHNNIQAAPGLIMREYRPKPLDKTKISYRIKVHTHFTQICEGVYPDGKTREDVEAVVKGTFGGRFERFGGGKFKYIAYTD